MRTIPRQLKFGNDIPHLAGNADYAAAKELLEAMDEIISQSGIEETAITSFLELAVFDKAARLFETDKPIVFRLTAACQSLSLIARPAWSIKVCTPSIILLGLTLSMN